MILLFWLSSRTTEDYMSAWVNRQFKGMMLQSDRRIANKISWDYTELLEKRRHEIMNADVYHPMHFGEAQNVLEISEEILSEASRLRKKIEDKDLSAFISLLYYPACATANLMKMWILAGRNKLFADQNRIEANELAQEIEECFIEDERLIEEYESVDGGYYKGFGKSEHIGFVNWNDEDNKYPLRHLVRGANRPRMLVSRKDDEHYMTGLEWCDRPQTWRDMLRPDVNTIEFDLINGSEFPYEFKIETDCNWIGFSKTAGTVKVRERIKLTADKDLLKTENRPYVEYHFQIQETGEYDLSFILAPTTPVTFKNEQFMGYSVNGGGIRVLNTVRQPEIPFFLSPQWEKEAKENVKTVEDKILCTAGVNKLRFYAMSPGIVLERILLVRSGIKLPESYLGPVESYMQEE